MQREESLGIGKGGWCRLEASDLAEPVFIRLGDQRGRLVVLDLFLASVDNGGLSADLLRRIPLGRLEAWVNEAEQAAHIRSRLREPGVDLRTLVSHYNVTFGPAKVDDWVTMSLRGGVKARALRSATPPKGDWTPPSPLGVPASRPYGDAFYQQVATAYQAYTAVSHRPVMELVEQNGVSLTTVQKWVRVARQRGFLPPPRQGKAG